MGNAYKIFENPSYSFSYGVSDVRTGDVKTVWEAKEGDTVKGQYSVLEPDGSMRTVEYSAGPTTGFQAVVNNEGTPRESRTFQTIPIVQEKAMRDYEHDRDYDFSEDADEEYYPKKTRKRENRDRIRDYIKKKRPQYSIDLEPSEYTHSYSIKHPYRDEEGADSESHISMDPNCKTKKKKENNIYTSISDLDLKKYPSFTSYDYDKYSSSNKYNKGKIEEYIKPGKIEEYIKPSKIEDYIKQGKIEDYIKTSKYPFSSVSDLPSFDKYYPDDLPPRPKKKYKPYKAPEVQFSDDLDDYLLVPKKKYKNPLKIPDLDDFQHGGDDDHERPNYDDDDRYHSIRGSSSAPKEVIRKVVKKKKPVINLLDIFDI